MKPFVEYLIKALIDCPPQMTVQEVSGSSTLVYELRLVKADIGKIVGKQGRTIEALRTILNGAGMRLGKRVSLEIIEDQPFVRPRLPSYNVGFDSVAGWQAHPRKREPS